MSVSFGTNVLKLLSSKIATQAISFITGPIIARIFLPEHFGTVQLFSSISGVIIVISCLRYDLSIPLGRDKNEVIASFIISVISTLAIALLSFVSMLILKEKVAVWLKSPELETFLWFLPLAVLLGGVGSAIRYYASRSGKFGAMAWADFGSVSGSIFITITFGLIFGASAKFLFIGQIAGMILNILILFIFLSREFLSEVRTINLSLRDIWEVAKYHKKFPIYDTWGGLFNSISGQLPPIILGAYFSTTVVGYYSLGNRFVGLPMALLGGSIAQVFFPVASKEYNETGRLNNIVSSTFKRLVQIGIFPMMVLGILGAPIFGFVFGPNWLEAGIYSQILSFWMFLVLITSPLSANFAVLDRQGTGLAFNTGLISSRLLALLLGSQTGQPRIALIAFVVVSVIGWIFMLLWILYNSHVSIKWGLKELLKYMLLSLVLLLPAFFIFRMQHNIDTMLIAIVFAIIIYFFALYRFEQSIRLYINGILTQLSGIILCKKAKN